MSDGAAGREPETQTAEQIAVRTVPIRFAAGGGRTGPLTVGQANMRRCVLRDEPAHMNACLIRALPEGIDLDRIAAAARTLAERHEVLRTTYPEQPVLHQRSAADGEFALAVHEAEGDAAMAAARAVGKRLQAIRFDPAGELPLRLAVITVDERPAQMVFVVCHIAADAAALDLLGREWDALMSGHPLPPPGALQPIDAALAERSPIGQRKLAASLRYWETVLRETPQSMFAIPGIDRTDWMHARLRIRSAAAAAALPAITERTGASPANVVLAALSALICRRLDHPVFVVATPAANRVAAEFADYVGTVAQDALASIQVADAGTFDELVRRVRARAFTALRHSRFDYEELLPVISQVEHERGGHWARDCVFNDLTGLSLDGLIAPTPVPAGGGPAEAGPGDPTLDWFLPESMMTRLMLWAVRLDEEVELALWADPVCLAPQDAETLAADLVRLLTAAAEGDVPLDRLDELSRLPVVRRGEGWYWIDRSWIELAAVRALLREVLGTRPHQVEAVPDEQLGHRLECRLAAQPAPPDAAAGGPPDVETDLAAIHAACLAGLRHRRLAAMAPHRYLIVDRAPQDPDDEAAWHSRPILAEGTGRGTTQDKDEDKDKPAGGESTSPETDLAGGPGAP